MIGLFKLQITLFCSSFAILSSQPSFHSPFISPSVLEVSTGRQSWHWLSCCLLAECRSKTPTRTLTLEFTLRKSPFPSFCLARVPWGPTGVNNKMCLWSRGAGEQGWNGGAGRVGNSEQKPSKRKEERSERLLLLLFGPQLRGGEIWSEGSYLLFGKPSSPTHSWMFTVMLSAMENRGFNTACCRELNIFSCKPGILFVLLHFTELSALWHELTVANIVLL